MNDEFQANGTTAGADEDSAEGLSPTLKGELWSDEDEEDGLHEGVLTQVNKYYLNCLSRGRLLLCMLRERLPCAGSGEEDSDEEDADGGAGSSDSVDSDKEMLDVERKAQALDADRHAPITL